MAALHISPEEYAPRQIVRRPLSAPIIPRERVMSLDERKAINREIEIEGLKKELAKQAEAIAALAYRPPARTSRVKGSPITYTFGQFYGDGRRNPFSTMEVVRALSAHICKVYGVTRADLDSQRRTHHLCMARHHLMHAIKKHTMWSLPQIGRYLGGRDHTTVLHGVRKHQQRIDAGLVKP